MCVSFCAKCSLVMAESSGQPLAERGAAWRRRQRRLRWLLRHEQQTVAAVLATVSHHSYPKVDTAHDGLQAQRTVTSTREGVEHETNGGLRAQKPPLPGKRRGLPPEPEPQVRAATVSHVAAGDGLPTLAMPSLVGAAGEVVDAVTLAFPAEPYFWHRYSGRSRWTLPAGASCDGVKRKKKKRKRRDEEEAMLLLMTSLRFSWLQGVHAKVTGCHIIVCSSDACDLRDLRGCGGDFRFLVYGCRIWNDCTGGVMSSAACGFFLVLRVLSTGFLSTTPIPYWFVCTAGLLGVKEAAFIWTRAAVDLPWPTSIGVLRWSVLSRGDSRLCVRDCRFLYDNTAGVNWGVEVVSAVRSQGHCGSCQASLRWRRSPSWC